MDHTVLLVYNATYAEIEFRVSGVAAAHFHFDAASRRVTAVARPDPITLPPSSLSEWNKETDRWKLRIATQYDVSAAFVPPTYFSVKREKDQFTGDTEMKCEVAGLEFKVQYEAATGMLTMNPRDAIDLTWGDFIWFVKQHSDLILEVQGNA